MKRTALLRRTKLRRSGETVKGWQRFRDAYAEECRGEDGKIGCECGCGIRAYSPDLTHIHSKASRPDLYFNKSNLRWMIREHHMAEHASS